MTFPRNFSHGSIEKSGILPENAAARRPVLGAQTEVHSMSTRIGKVGSPAPPAASPQPPDSSPPFAVERSPIESARSPSTAGPTSAVDSPLGRFRSGAVDLDGYLNLKVEEATAHLGSLPPAQLEAIRATLRERLTSDPLFVDLVRTATSSVASAPSSRDD